MPLELIDTGEGGLFEQTFIAAEPSPSDLPQPSASVLAYAAEIEDLLVNEYHQEESAAVVEATATP